MTRENIGEAIDLLHSIFEEDVRIGEAPSIALWGCLEPEKNKDFYTKHNIKDLEYFVVLDEDTKKVIGTTGLYTRTIDSSDIVWLGWYCVSPDKRDKGLGSEILNWTIERARKRGFKKMKLYTSDSQNEKAAQHVYEKFHLKLIGKERRLVDLNNITLYRERDL